MGSDSADGDSVRSRFLRSPDATEEGEIVVDGFFGFDWFHAATIIDTNVPSDDSGMLRGIRVRKFHKVIFGAGSTLVLLESPAGNLYFRIGRDADRTVDVPTIPEGWSLVEVTPESVGAPLGSGKHRHPYRQRGLLPGTASRACVIALITRAHTNRGGRSTAARLCLDIQLTFQAS